MPYWINKYRLVAILIIAITVCVPQAVFATGVTNAGRQHSFQETVNSIDAEEIEPLPPAGLDSTTIELFTGAVSDLHETAKSLNCKLGRIEDRIRLLRAENKLLRRENNKIRRLAKMKKKNYSQWAAFPLDHEVKRANQMLENLVTNLTGLMPFSSKTSN